MRKVGRLAILMTVLAMSGVAQAAPFAPYKDMLFAYPGPVASLDGGRRLDVPYDEVRDIDRRDAIPERQVKSVYIDLRAVGRVREQEITTPGGPLRYATVGTAAPGGPVVVFVHGRNGDHRLGMKDGSFGGNFNRLKNLLVRAGGQYVTVDGGQLAAADAARIGHLLAEIRRERPAAMLVLACASMGGQVCWTLATGEGAKMFDAMVLLGSDSSAERFAAMRRAHDAIVPILLAHGTRDKVYAFDRQLTFFEAVRKQSPAYPIRFVGFDGGNHGTPIRMVDWRDTLNWIAGEVSPSASR
ncbi:alpha/beta hydrolase [Aureimonas sp. SK2]|uniref:alpha/beta hydrolase n=1 Tax=Aureimonas sp. SK2 TaxID=3015992 RepID=UPI002443CD93|nr:alpha/beta hydrolase [Aureimonas sp. SK2]